MRKNRYKRIAITTFLLILLGVTSQHLWYWFDLKKRISDTDGMEEILREENLSFTPSDLDSVRQNFSKMTIRYQPNTIIYEDSDGRSIYLYKQAANPQIFDSITNNLSMNESLGRSDSQWELYRYVLNTVPSDLNPFHSFSELISIHERLYLKAIMLTGRKVNGLRSYSLDGLNFFQIGRPEIQLPSKNDVELFIFSGDTWKYNVIFTDSNMKGFKQDEIDQTAIFLVDAKLDFPD